VCLYIDRRFGGGAGERCGTGGDAGAAEEATKRDDRESSTTAVRFNMIGVDTEPGFVDWRGREDKDFAQLEKLSDPMTVIACVVAIGA